MATSKNLNLMASGIFTVPDAAILVGMSTTKVRGWIAGYPQSKIDPVVDNDLGWIDGKLAFSFSNLMELRFISVFSRAGVRLAEIRNIMSEAKSALNHPHPFATKTVFRTDGRKIVAEIVRKNRASGIFDLRSKNYEMGEVVWESLKDDVVYDPAGEALAWYPRRSIAPNVIIHPQFAFGRPILKDSRIKTQTLAQAVAAEGNISDVADWYEISQQRVREAVNFENSLAQIS